ncbi:hypothetical protein N9Y42_09035, partial [Mariniblastus sp.]|nr:hypothetical protein [Mariniblastus sp.]
SLYYDRSIRFKSDPETAASGGKLSNVFRKLLGAVLLLTLASVLYYFWLLLPPPAYRPVKRNLVGEPNSFSELVAAGKAFSIAGLGDWALVNSGPKLAGRIQAQSKNFDHVELLLESANCSCIDWNRSNFDFEKLGIELKDVQSIASAISVRSLQSLSEKRSDDVVADGFLCMKLAEQISIDGNFEVLLTGAACERAGVESAVPGIEGASLEQLEKAAKQLDETIALFGTSDAEMERLVNAENFFVAKSKQSHWIKLLIFHQMNYSSAEHIVRGAITHRNVVRQLLRTEIAIRLYQIKFGRPPDSLERLIPDFLDEVPNDGFANPETQPVHYKLSADSKSYQLYSVGRNDDDDGGQVFENFWEQGDLDLIALFGDRLVKNAKEVARHEADKTAGTPTLKASKPPELLDERN